MTREYLPTTLAEVSGWYVAGQIPRTSPRLTAPEDTDLGEYSALMGAADSSAELPGGDGRRMVLVIEAPNEPTTDATAWRFVVALHVDVAPDVDHDEELAWYATQEIGALLGL